MILGDWLGKRCHYRDMRVRRKTVSQRVTASIDVARPGADQSRSEIIHRPILMAIDDIQHQPVARAGRIDMGRFVQPFALECRRLRQQLQTVAFRMVGKEL